MLQQNYFRFNLCYNLAMIRKTLESSPHFHAPTGIDRRNPVVVDRSTRGRRNHSQVGMFTQVSSQVESVAKPISSEISAFFKGRDLPTDVWAPSGVAYYERIEDIPEVLFSKTTTPPKIASWETRAAVALQVCPPAEGGPADSSFRIIGDRGLYVRVVLGQVEEQVGEITRKKPIIRWMHYNEEAADFKNIRYT